MKLQSVLAATFAVMLSTTTAMAMAEPLPYAQESHLLAEIDEERSAILDMMISEELFKLKDNLSELFIKLKNHGQDKHTIALIAVRNAYLSLHTLDEELERIRADIAQLEEITTLETIEETLQKLQNNDFSKQAVTAYQQALNKAQKVYVTYKI